MYLTESWSIMITMKRIVLGLAAVALIVLAPTPANARPYPGDRRIGAHLAGYHECTARGSSLERLTAQSFSTTLHEVRVRNHTRHAIRVRVVEVSHGVKISDGRRLVSRRWSATSPGFLLYVRAGQQEWVTVSYRGRVLVHRHLASACS
jgi:hypothetical protein